MSGPWATRAFLSPCPSDLARRPPTKPSMPVCPSMPPMPLTRTNVTLDCSSVLSGNCQTLRKSRRVAHLRSNKNLRPISWPILLPIFYTLLTY